MEFRAAATIDDRGTAPGWASRNDEFVFANILTLTAELRPAFDVMCQSSDVICPLHVALRAELIVKELNRE